MKNLENSALMQEMNVNEMQEVNGGWVALALAVAAAAIMKNLMFIVIILFFLLKIYRRTDLEDLASTYCYSL